MIAAVTRNRALTRLLLSYLLLVVAEYGQWLALLIYAYGRGGASAAGLVAVLQLLPALLLAPLVSARLARLGPARLLSLASAVGAATLACCGAAILAHASVTLVYAAAIAFSLSLGVSRPLHPVLLPLVVGHPDELTAANVATSWCEGFSTLAGPAVAGLLVGIDGPGLACAVLAGLILVTPLLAGVQIPYAAEHDSDELGAVAALVAAARVIASRPSTRALSMFPLSAAVIEGAIDLLVVVLAVRVLALGSGAAGYLSAAFGAGGLVGGIAAVVLVGRRLAVPLMGAALLGAAALGASAFASAVVVAVLLLAVLGAARSVQTIAAQTLLQRSTPLEVVVLTFTLIESMRDAGLAFSALLVPLLISLGGVHVAFIGIACVAPLVVLLTARRIHRIDAEATIPVVEIGVLRALDIFRALPAAALETLAREAEYASFQAGATIICEGEDGDGYYAIAHGSVVVTKAEREIRRLAAGDGFGEIALLRAVTRTATVRATSETSVLRVGREPFLAAMGANPASSATAERIADELLEYAR